MLQEPRKKIRTPFSQKCFCPQFTATVTVNTQAQPWWGQCLLRLPRLCPESAPLGSPSSHPHCSGPLSFLPPAPIPPPSTHIQALQSCQISPQRVKFGLFSSSFITFSCSHFLQCSAALHAVFLGTVEKTVLLWGQQGQGPTGAHVSSAVQTPVMWMPCYLWWCLSCTRHLKVHRGWEKEFFSVASEVALVRTYCRKNTSEASNFHIGWALNACRRSIWNSPPYITCADTC